MIVCPNCGESEWEKRGDQRIYIVLNADLEEVTFNRGEIVHDGTKDGKHDIIYCVQCDSEFTEDELKGAK